MLTQTTAWPWGRTGHRVSAMIAESQLTPVALAAVRSRLGPGESLADVSTWADEQREVPRSGPWYYVGVPWYYVDVPINVLCHTHGHIHHSLGCAANHFNVATGGRRRAMIADVPSLSHFVIEGN